MHILQALSSQSSPIWITVNRQPNPSPTQKAFFSVIIGRNNHWTKNFGEAWRMHAKCNFMAGLMYCTCIVIQRNSTTVIQWLQRKIPIKVIKWLAFSIANLLFSPSQAIFKIETKKNVFTENENKNIKFSYQISVLKPLETVASSNISQGLFW